VAATLQGTELAALQLHLRKAPGIANEVVKEHRPDLDNLDVRGPRVAALALDSAPRERRLDGLE
jgi:hypothetical protein